MDSSDPGRGGATGRSVPLPVRFKLYMNDDAGGASDPAPATRRGSSVAGTVRRARAPRAREPKPLTRRGSGRIRTPRPSPVCDLVTKPSPPEGGRSRKPTPRQRR